MWDTETLPSNGGLEKNDYRLVAVVSIIFAIVHLIGFAVVLTVGYGGIHWETFLSIGGWVSVPAIVFLVDCVLLVHLMHLRVRTVLFALGIPMSFLAMASIIKAIQAVIPPIDPGKGESSVTFLLLPISEISVLLVSTLILVAGVLLQRRWKGSMKDRKGA